MLQKSSHKDAETQRRQERDYDNDYDAQDAL
jgi:hypothetical protein